MILNLTVWDDAAGKKHLRRAASRSPFESLDQGLSSGVSYTKTAEEQLKNLSQNAATVSDRRS